MVDRVVWENALEIVKCRAPPQPKAQTPEMNAYLVRSIALAPKCTHMQRQQIRAILRGAENISIEWDRQFILECVPLLAQVI